MVGTEPCSDIADPRELPLPCRRALWEARDSWAWEKEYDASWRTSRTGESLLRTVGDYKMAKYSAHIGADDIAMKASQSLDEWHADLDSLGMALAAVLAGL